MRGLAFRGLTFLTGLAAVGLAVGCTDSVRSSEPSYATAGAGGGGTTGGPGGGVGNQDAGLGGGASGGQTAQGGQAGQPITTGAGAASSRPAAGRAGRRGRRSGRSGASGSRRAGVAEQRLPDDQLVAAQQVGRVRQRRLRPLFHAGQRNFEDHLGRRGAAVAAPAGRGHRHRRPRQRRADLRRSDRLLRRAPGRNPGWRQGGPARRRDRVGAQGLRDALPGQRDRHQPAAGRQRRHRDRSHHRRVHLAHQSGRVRVDGRRRPGAGAPGPRADRGRHGDRLVEPDRRFVHHVRRRRRHRHRPGEGQGRGQRVAAGPLRLRGHGLRRRLAHVAGGLRRRLWRPGPAVAVGHRRRGSRRQPAAPRSRGLVGGVRRSPRQLWLGAERAFGWRAEPGVRGDVRPEGHRGRCGVPVRLRVGGRHAGHDAPRRSRSGQPRCPNSCCSFPRRC